MQVSREWLQTFFDTELPSASEIETQLTFHSVEVEEVLARGDDAVLDLSILPDKAAWMLSHRGIARELATILDIPLSHDPLATEPTLQPLDALLNISLATEECARYAAARISGVAVGPSPAWLVRRLEAIGQRSVNNVVDATNYVMFHLGQPLHAFDADKCMAQGGVYAIAVRAARAGEEITTLTDDAYKLTERDLVIVDAAVDEPIGIAGVKGGKRAAVDEGTRTIILESANFDRAVVRRTAQRHRLRTDASARFENGVVPELAGYGLAAAAELIVELAGGTVEGYADVFPHPRQHTPVSVSVEKVCSVLGVTLTQEHILDIFRRFGFEVSASASVITVVPPFERNDLSIPEDLIEEVGRMHGLEHIPSHAPERGVTPDINAHFAHTEHIRDALAMLGFSEVYTSSFRSSDQVALENALASDKGFLRSDLRANIDDALARNVLLKDLLGLPRVALFEIGTVFTQSGEHRALAFGVRTGPAYKSKADDPLMDAACARLRELIGADAYNVRDGIAEINLDEVLAHLPAPDAYPPLREASQPVVYTPFSSYPHISRDVALWADAATAADAIHALVAQTAGDLLVRSTLFDTYQKDGRVSYAFRLVFQAKDRTLTDAEVQAIMERIYAALAEGGFEVR